MNKIENMDTPLTQQEAAKLKSLEETAMVLTALDIANWIDTLGKSRFNTDSPELLRLKISRLNEIAKQKYAELEGSF